MNQLTASKKELSTTFDRISYYMAELDPEGFILDINQAFLHFVDRECVGRHLSTVLDFPEEGAAVLKRLLDAAETGGKHKKEEVQVGKSILEIEVFPIDDPKGNVEKMLFMADDVTGVRMAERQLLQDNKMIAVGQLAAGVAHEIRNPLGVIRNYCYVLKNMDDEDTQKQAIQAIERSVDTSGKIIENLLNFSRVSHRTVESFLIKSILMICCF